MKVAAIALNTYREAIRNKILYSVILFAITIVAISALFGSVTIGDQVVLLKDFGLFALSFFGALVTIICGVSLLNKEIKQKTIYNILSKPVERWQFIIGKYLGLTMTSATLVGLMGFALFVFIALFEESFDFLLLGGVAFVLMEVSLIAAVTIFFSSVVITTTLSGLFTLGAYIAGRSIAYLAYYFSEGEGYNPALAGLTKALQVVLPDLSLYNFSDALVYGEPVAAQAYLLGFGYCIGYSVVLLVLAQMIFNKRELV